VDKSTTYKASDRRVYDGAPCSDMKRELDHTAMLRERMKQIDSTACCTYFPAEGKYLVFINSNILENRNLVGPPRLLTGHFHDDEQEALTEAIRVLETVSESDSDPTVYDDYVYGENESKD